MKEFTEHQEQVALMKWIEIFSRFYPCLSLIFAVPNGGKRHPKTAKNLKAEGVKAGVPDLFLPVAKGLSHGLFIEMKKVSAKPKRGGKGGVRDNQREWIEALRGQGYSVEICYGMDEARTVITNYISK